MRKGWLIFLLVLVISGQLVVLSSFHDVEIDGFATGNTVIGIAKWNYVQGVVRVSITPMAPSSNGTSNVVMVLPNGTSRTFGSTYSFILQLPRTGDSLGNGAISGLLALSESQPLNVTVFQNVGNVPDYVNYLKGSSSNSLLPVDVYTIVIYGQADVLVSGYGIGL
jgi:hypothetical protein